MGLTKFNVDTNNIQGLANKPTQSASQLKALFDKAGVDIKNYLNQILTEEIDSKISEFQTKINDNTSLINNMLNTVYPVGSIYMSVNNTNPSTIFGGTWVSWGAGKVPVGVNANETEFNSVEKTGGAKTHTLTIQQIPSHGHSVSIASSGSCTTSANGRHAHSLDLINHCSTNGNGQVFGPTTSPTNYKTSEIVDHTHTVPNHTHTVNQSNAGGGQAHNNLQPYITCYMWKRTA